MDLFVKKDKSDIGPTTAISNSSDAPAKIDAMKNRDQEIQQRLDTAVAAMNDGDLDAAEQAYIGIQQLAPDNLRAEEGLRRIAMQRQHAQLLESAQSLLGKSEEDDERAGEILRGILVENPANAQAVALYRELNKKQAEKRIEATRKKLVYANPVTLDFRDAPIKMIAEAIAKSTGVNVVLDKDVPTTQKATLFVRNTPLEDAIDLLAQSNQLLKKVLNEKSVILYPNNPVKLREYQDLVIRSFYLEYADPKAVSSLLKSMLGVKQVQTDDRIPMVMIKDVPEIMPLAEKLILSQDVPDPEVMLELEVLEITRSNTLNTGVTWPNQLTVIPIGTVDSAGSAPALTLQQLKNINSSGIAVSPNPAVNFGGTDSKTNLLANPRIRIKNKEKARIHIGDRVPVITSNVSSTGVSTENVQYIDVGLKLEAEPLISLGGDVTLKLNLDVGSLGTQITTKNGAVVYQIGTRSTSTQLRLKDGETQILAGLISDQDRRDVSKLPGLGDIPLLGRLFSNHGDSKSKTEIVLSVTPHIIREHRAADASAAEYWSGTEMQAGRNMNTPRLLEGLQTFIGMPKPAVPVEPPKDNVKPQGLNIPLPAGLGTPLENGPGTRPEQEQ